MSEDTQKLLNNEQIADILYKPTVCKPCVYFLFRFGTYVLVLIGIGDLVGSVLVYTSTKTIDWYNGAYGLLGVFITFLAVFSYTTRESIKGTCAYLFFLFLGMLAQLGVSLGILFYTDYVRLMGFKDAQTVRYSMIASAGVMFLALLVGILYYCMIAKEYQKRYNYFLIYGEPPNDFEPVVGENL